LRGPDVGEVDGFAVFAFSDGILAQIDIDAPVDKVWELITDTRRMPEWSPQCRKMKTLGPLRQGTRTLNVNRRKRLYWTTTSTITEVIPQRKFAFRVNTNNTIWSYELEPTATGTRVVESRHAENGVKPASNFLVNMLFGGATLIGMALAARNS